MRYKTMSFEIGMFWNRCYIKDWIKLIHRNYTKIWNNNTLILEVFYDAEIHFHCTYKKIVRKSLGPSFKIRHVSWLFFVQISFDSCPGLRYYDPPLATRSLPRGLHCKYFISSSYYFLSWSILYLRLMIEKCHLSIPERCPMIQAHLIT